MFKNQELLDLHLHSEHSFYFDHMFTVLTGVT